MTDVGELPHESIDLGLARIRDGKHRYRLGVMGGTFDPIHHGHLVAASEVAARFDLQEVVFVPTGTPWQKVGRKVSNREDRYLMTVIATASNPRFSVSRVDIDRPGNTYTVDTLKELKAERGEDVDLTFITGAGALGSIRVDWLDSLVAIRRERETIMAAARAHDVGTQKPEGRGS